MDRFDLEQSINSLHGTIEALDLLNENILENDSVSQDDIANAILGISTILKMKHDKIFNTFKAVFHLDEFNYHNIV